MSDTAAARRPPARRAPQRRHAFGGTLLGVFIGIVVGLGMASTVAYWLMKNNPALPMPSLARDAREPARDAVAKVAKADADKPRFDFYRILPGVEEAKVAPERRVPDAADRAVAEQAKDRLGGQQAARTPLPDAAKGAQATVAPDAAQGARQSRATDAAQAVRTAVATDAAQARVPDKLLPVDASPKLAKPADRFWLQAGSFSTVPDAENLRARLALAGWEAMVQEGALPDKSIRYRVRLGPYDSADELGRMKTELAKRGFDVAVIRN